MELECFIKPALSDASLSEHVQYVSRSARTGYHTRSEARLNTNEAKPVYLHIIFDVVNSKAGLS